MNKKKKGQVSYTPYSLKTNRYSYTLDVEIEMAMYSVVVMPARTARLRIKVVLSQANNQVTLNVRLRRTATRNAGLVVGGLR